MHGVWSLQSLEKIMFWVRIIVIMSWISERMNEVNTELKIEFGTLEISGYLKICWGVRYKNLWEWIMERIRCKEVMITSKGSSVLEV